MEMPEYFEFCGRVNLVAGHDALEQIPGLLLSMGAKNLMIITDQGVSRAGLVEILVQSLDSRITVRTIQDEVPPDSDIDIVHTLARRYRKNTCDAIISLGGGSVMDTAKGMNILVSEGADNLRAFTGAGVLKHRLKPLIAVPTTAGTGSEVTQVAVIADPDHGRKLFFTSHFLIPDAAVIDPRMTLTLPPHITAATAMDALSHAVEASICLAENPLSTALAHDAIDLIRCHLPRVVNHPDDPAGRLALATAAALAGMAFSNSMVGMVHTLGHAVGSVCHVPHGACMAVLLPHGMTYNYHRTQTQLADLLLPLAGEEIFARTAPRDRAQKAIDQVRQINQGLHLATAGAHAVRLKDITDKNRQILVPLHRLPEIAGTALGDGSIFYNPEDLEYDDCLMVLEAAFHGEPLDRSSIRKG
ncbi:MAG: iron-containing alcohol dehydrogenase [Desulfotignum sp.]|nr:iron-containing alcohol dehydrogenase [Desulfotignum sp.]